MRIQGNLMTNRPLWLLMLLSLMLGMTSVRAQEFGSRDELTGPQFEKHRFSFGVQFIPDASGLSFKYRMSEHFQIQGVLRPDNDEPGGGLRLHRILDSRRFWESYLFGSYAMARDKRWDRDEYEDRSTLSFGLGVEWNWQGRNRNLPPLLPSLEFGAGLDEDSETFMVAGFGFHYGF